MARNPPSIRAFAFKLARRRIPAPRARREFPLAPLRACGQSLALLGRAITGTRKHPFGRCRSQMLQASRVYPYSTAKWVLFQPPSEQASAAQDARMSRRPGMAESDQRSVPNGCRAPPVRARGAFSAPGELGARLGARGAQGTARNARGEATGRAFFRFLSLCCAGCANVAGAGMRRSDHEQR